MNESPFINTPLDPANIEIRLLELYPRSRETPDLIQCEIRLGNLHHIRRSYEALSYEWGVPGLACSGIDFEVLPSTKRLIASKPEFSVLVSGHVMPVGENLWWALHHLQSEETRLIWVDALCINQENIKEKNQQVPLMGEIYRNSKRVVAWIGREYKYGRSKPSPNTRAITDETIWKGITNVNSSAIIRTPQEIPVYLREHSDFMLGFRAICSRTYWTRIWIIQELVLPYELVLQCGSLSFQWRSLANFLRAIARWADEVQWPGPNSYFADILEFDHAPQIYADRRRHPIGTELKTFHTLELVKIHEVSKSKDVRDRIFGLHSLCTSCCHEAVPVDYSATSAKVFKRALKHYFVAHHDQVKTPSLSLGDIKQISPHFGFILPRHHGVRWFFMKTMLKHSPASVYWLIVGFSHVNVQGRRKDGAQRAVHNGEYTFPPE